MTTLVIRSYRWAVAFVLVLAGLGVAATSATRHAPSVPTADPLYCVVVTDAQGHPIDTVCVPWPFRSSAV